jgi:hypothetical protein
MSQAEAGVLVQWGRLWLSHMTIMNDEAKRDELINHINGELNAIGFKIGRGWMTYDPVIRRANGRASSYADIAGWASRHSDNGRAAAQLFYNWATDTTTGLLSLPTELQDLAIITHLAEVARGHSWAIANQLYPLLQDISAGNKSWGDYREFAPSLKYPEDNRMDWNS